MADTILHNQPTSEPSNDERIAFGTPSTPIRNITLANFYTLLMTKLGFFKVANLFSEIPENEKATARANLDVWKGSDISASVNERALNTNVIRRNETVAFTPNIGTHPVNKAYIDGRFKSGRVIIGDPKGGVKPYVVAFTSPMSADYAISLTFESVGEVSNLDNDFSVPVVIGALKSLSGFTFVIEETSDAIQNINMYWTATAYNS